MSYSIDATIEKMSDRSCDSMIVTFPEETVWKLLGFITGLQVHRMKAFVIRGASAEITVSSDAISIQLPDRRIEKRLTQDMYESFVCCCFDKAFDVYPEPHVDLEFDDLDVTFGWFH